MEKSYWRFEKVCKNNRRECKVNRPSKGKSSLTAELFLFGFVGTFTFKFRVRLHSMVSDFILGIFKCFNSDISTEYLGRNYNNMQAT